MKLRCVCKQLIIKEIVVEAAGVELITILITRNLLILGTATTAKKAPLPDPLYVYCTKYVSLLRPADSRSRHSIPWIRNDGTRKNTQLPKLSIMNLLEQRTLGLGRFHRCRAFCVVIGDMVDPRADGIASHGPSVARLQHF